MNEYIGVAISALIGCFISSIGMGIISCKCERKKITWANVWYEYGRRISGRE